MTDKKAGFRGEPSLQGFMDQRTASQIAAEGRAAQYQGPPPAIPRWAEELNRKLDVINKRLQRIEQKLNKERII